VSRARLHLLVTSALAAATLASSRPAYADRYEATLSLRPTWGSARIWEAGTDARADVRTRGAAASASLGVRDWLDLGGEFVMDYLDEASYPMATLPIKARPLTGPVKRISNTAQLRGIATFRFGIRWVPFVRLALGLGARYRTTALLWGPTTQGYRWLIPDDQTEEVTLDIVTGVRVGLERRLTVRWTAGVSAAVAHALGVYRPDLQTSDVTLSLSYSWYPLWAP
jgi:hypothetical protein